MSLEEFATTGRELLNSRKLSLGDEETSLDHLILALSTLSRFMRASVATSVVP
jgi:hypothetical protein